MKKKIPIALIVITFGILTLNSCRHALKNIVKYKGNYICISLNQYLIEINKLAETRSKIPSDIGNLFGMSWLVGYVVDTKNKDIILIGEDKEGRPPYNSQDIFINLQNVFDSASSPICSLDPNPVNIEKFDQYLATQTDDYEKRINNSKSLIGGQKVVTGGVPANSRHAYIMIYADYDMKKISQGFLSIPGVHSTIEFSEKENPNFSSAHASMSRYWLHIKKSEGNQTYPNFNENDGIVFINECPVVVLTEKEKIDADGNLKDDISDKDKIATSFAAEMSSNYSRIASKDPLFAELENMFRLQACLKAIKFKQAFLAASIDESKWERLRLLDGNDLPDSLTGLVNYRKISKNVYRNKEEGVETRFFIVAGGVSQEMKINKTNIYRNSYIRNFTKNIINSRPDSQSIYWNVHLDDKRS